MLRIILAVLLTLATAANAETADWLAEHYTKHEHMIPMRDGVRLLTRVYEPKDDSQHWPIVLTRTPYGLKPYGAGNYGEAAGSYGTLAKDGFICVTQDVRGRYGSEGTFVHVRPFNPHKTGPKDIDESTDAYDTIDWLVKHVPNNNGKVGVRGTSYPGFYAAMAMIDSHPALKAASPQAPIADWFMGDDLHHNGAFLLAQNFGFMYQFPQRPEDVLHQETQPFYFPTADGYDFFLRMGALVNADAKLMRGRSPDWNEFLAHPDYDAYWQSRSSLPHLQHVRCAVMTVGGWYDAEDLYGTLQTHRATGRLNPGVPNSLVMGPWAHGDWGKIDGDKLGPISFHAKTAEYFREKIELPFFRHYLKDDDKAPPPPAAQVFETGTNQWRRFDAWPPRNAAPRTLYFHAAGRLDFNPPTETGSDAFDEYISDPAKPVPYTTELTIDYPKAYVVADQRFAASRPDVTVYQTEPLEEDLTFAGPLQVNLHAATTGTDADWVVKVIDVHAGDETEGKPGPEQHRTGGYQQLVRGDVFRGRYRHSFEKPEAIQPGKVEAYDFTMPDILHTFRRGHRVMIQVQSSWFPLVDRNPQTFVPILTARPEDFKKAAQQIHHSAAAASSLTVPVLK